jgi:hypothetical protein
MFMRIAQLRRLAEVYIAGTGEAPSTVSKRIRKTHDKIISRILDGHGISAKTSELTEDWFVANWPSNVPWPGSVPHPTALRADVAAE